MSGSLNVALADGYLAELVFRNNLGEEHATVAGVPSSAHYQEDFTFDALEVTYTCADTASACAGFRREPPSVIKAGGAIRAGEQYFLRTNTLARETEEMVSEIVHEEPVVVNAAIVLAGRFGSGASFRTASFDLPMDVYAAGKPQCDWSKVLSVVGNPPCKTLVGQDSDSPCVESASR